MKYLAATFALVTLAYVDASNVQTQLELAQVSSSNDVIPIKQPQTNFRTFLNSNG